MRLGDLDELKKYKFTTQIANGVEIEDIEVVPVAAIDNALTVKFSLMPADETKEDAYKRGYERGKIAGILKANTRPQGELANEVWKLYEKHRSHLATHVIEFGDELKELLCKYQKGGAE